MQQSNKTSIEIMDIVTDFATKIGQLALVCLVLSLLASLGY
ncbi:hypothetical protein [Glaciecola sp. SC05]